MVTVTAAFVFFVYLNLPSFGGPVEVRFSQKTEDACNHMRKAVVKMLKDNDVRYIASLCEQNKEKE